MPAAVDLLQLHEHREMVRWQACLVILELHLGGVGNALKVFSNVSSIRYFDMAQIPAELVVTGTPERLGKPGTELWLSFLIRPDANDPAGTNTAGLQLLGTTNGGTVKLLVGDHTTGGTWGIGRASTFAGSGIPATTGTTTLLVARLQFVAGNGNDQADLWVNPALGTSPPPSPAATLTGLDIGSFDRVDIKGNRTSTLDEVTFGTTWGSVIGQ